jgi:hypothetical protein
MGFWISEAHAIGSATQPVAAGCGDGSEAAADLIITVYQKWRGCRCDPFCSVWMDSFLLAAETSVFRLRASAFRLRATPVLEFHQFTII